MLRHKSSWVTKRGILALVLDIITPALCYYLHNPLTVECDCSAGHIIVSETKWTLDWNLSLQRNDSNSREEETKPRFGLSGSDFIVDVISHPEEPL